MKTHHTEKCIKRIHTNTSMCMHTHIITQTFAHVILLFNCTHKHTQNHSNICARALQNLIILCAHKHTHTHKVYKTIHTHTHTHTHSLTQTHPLITYLWIILTLPVGSNSLLRVLIELSPAETSMEPPVGGHVGFKTIENGLVLGDKRSTPRWLVNCRRHKFLHVCDQY